MADLDLDALEQDARDDVEERERLDDERGFSADVLTLLSRLRAAERERDEARAACIRAEEDHRAAVESLETYESRIRDIADNVLGIRPPDVATIVLLDAIERRCGEERIAARQAEAEVARLRRIEEAAAELVAIIPRPVDGHARSTNLVLVADMLRDALKEDRDREELEIVADAFPRVLSRLRAAEERVRELEAALGKQWREGYDDGYGSALTDGAELRAVADSARVVDMAESRLSGDTVSALISRLRAAEERAWELEAEAVKLRVDHASWCLERKELIARHGELADRALVAEHDLRAVAEAAREYVLGEDDDGDFGRLLRLESRLAALDAAKRGTP